MNTTDILIIIGISFFVVVGFRDGFFKKVFGFFGFWGGLIAAIKFMDPVSELLRGWIDLSIEVAVIIAFFVIFLFCVVLVNLLYRWWGKSGSETLAIRTRIWGSALGLCQGLLVVSLVLLMFSIFDSPSEEEQKASLLYKKTIGIAPFVFDYSTRWMPSSKAFFEEVKSKIETFKAPH